MTDLMQEKQQKNQRYINENVVHAIRVLEALESAGYEALPISRIIERTRLSYDKTRRVLLTLESVGWAEAAPQKSWKLGARLIRFSNRYAEVCLAMLEGEG